MGELAASILPWLVPAVVVFGGAAALSVLAIWLLRRRRRSPAARARAEAERAAAGADLVRLDDAIAELDLELGLSGALYDGSAPDGLRRARMTATHARDASFAQLLELTPETHPDEIVRVARGILSRTGQAREAVRIGRAEHATWMSANVSATTQIEAAHARARVIGAELGDPGELLAALAESYDPSEWAEARRDAALAMDALGDAEELIRAAEQRADDPTRSALPALADAERALRAAQAASRRFEEHSRLVADAAAAVSGEVDDAREALRQALAVRASLEPAASERLGAEIREISEELTVLGRDAAQRPTAAVTGIVRLRERLDLALGDARTAQQRLRGARSALPGALAVARDAVARGEARMGGAGVDARARLESARRELAAARSAADPVGALDAARRAFRHAEDAVALADYDVMSAQRTAIPKDSD